ncbi:MAG TPA: hypothetical protein VGJ25_10070 [Gaiellaceae bacterium]
MPRLSEDERTGRLLAGLVAASAAVRELDRLLADARREQRETLGELAGRLPIVSLVEATGLTRQTVHRLLRRQQKEVAQ